MRSESDIQKLKSIEHIRLRPGMYIGGVDEKALHYLVLEALKDMEEEILAGYGDHIWITLKPNNEISIRDNGSGIPIKKVDSLGQSQLEVYMTGSGQRFSRNHGRFYTGGGLRGLGLWAVNALSAFCTIQVAREGYLWEQTYREGIPQGEVFQVRALEEREATGTTITFSPDFAIFEQNEIQYEFIAERARELAYLFERLTVILRDERSTPHREERFYFPIGIESLINDLNKGLSPLHKPIIGHGEETFQPSARLGLNVSLDYALQYTDSMEIVERSYANTIQTRDGGTHLLGIWSAITTVINEYALSAGDNPFTQEEIAAGLTVVVSIKLDYPNFENQSQRKLINPEVYGIVAGLVYAKFHSSFVSDWSIPHEEFRGIILNKCRANRKALRGNGS